MSDSKPTQEEIILHRVKKVLSSVAKDTATQPGFKHPLSDETVVSLRDCLRLISEREQEIGKELGRSWSQRPYFVDDENAPKDAVVSVESLTGKTH